MKAAVVREYNKISIEEVPTPELEEGEALIKVSHMGICGSDVHIYEGKLAANYPIIPGHEFSGYLADIKSKKHENLKVGQKVVAHPLTSCGICEMCITGRDNTCKQVEIFGVHEAGGFAEYVKVPANKVYSLPENMDLKLSALLEPLAVAVHDVRRSGLRIGETVYIVGGGPIGILTALVAKTAGASRVLVGEFNDYRIKFMRDLGIEVVDLKETSLETAVADVTQNKGFDIVFEDSGARAAYNDMMLAVKNGGTIMLIGMPADKQMIDVTACAKRELTLIGCRIHANINYAAALEVLKSGELSKKIEKLITHTFPFDQIEEAMEFAAKDQEHVKVIVEMND